MIKWIMNAASGGSNNENGESRALGTCDRGRVLVVEDDPSIATMFKLVIETSPCALTVDVSEDSHHAVDLFRAHRHAVVVSDVTMPGLTGPEVFSAIEAVCAGDRCEMPSFVFCTGNAYDQDVQRILDADRRHAILLKPVSCSSLLDIIGSRLDRVD